MSYLEYILKNIIDKFQNFLLIIMDKLKYHVYALGFAKKRLVCKLVCTEKPVRKPVSIM